MNEKPVNVVIQDVDFDEAALLTRFKPSQFLFEGSIEGVGVLGVMCSSVAIRTECDDMCRVIWPLIRQLSRMMRFQIRGAVRLSKRGRGFAGLAVAV
jgi:hypothetical protein